MLRVWAVTIVHVHKLQENDDEDDLKINMPGITPDDMITDDPGDVVVDTSEYDRSVYKVKLDQEVYNKGTVDDPAAEITGAADGVKEEPVTVNSSSYKKVEPMEKTHHASLEEAGHKYDDDAAPNMMMMQQSRTCERNSWTATCIVLANLYPQLSHLNLCAILLG